MKLQMIGAIYLAVCLYGCGNTHINHHHGFMGPDTWEISKNGHSVWVYAGDCSRPSLLAAYIKEGVDKGAIDWALIAVDKDYERVVVHNACEKIIKQGRKQ